VAIALLGLVILLSGPAAESQQPPPRLPRPDTVVKPAVFVSAAPVARGAAFEIAVVGEILPGFHINANKVLEDYLIPTTVESPAAPGLKIVSTAYPEAQLKKFPFSESKLAVYEGKFVVRLKLQAAADAPLGARSLPLTLRYQACNDQACLPPARLALNAAVEIAAAGTRGKPQHPEIFRKK
jgi:hypothetical protein